MSIGDKKDHKLFNCSQQHEIDFVKKQYTNPADVEDWIKEECIPRGKINNTAHKELYAMLKTAGFTKI